MAHSEMMNTEQPAMLRLISSAVSVAAKAGAEVRRITRTGQLGVIDKGVQDYQTKADRTAQRMIVASLAKKFPKCTIVGEEDLEEDKEADANLVTSSFDEDVLKMSLPDAYADVKEEDITIWVDPLDGTTEFVKGLLLEHVTVLIGISVKSRSVAGIIHQPFYGHSADRPDSTTGRTMWGLVGLGCFGIESKTPPSDKLIVTTTASHGNANIDETIAAVKPDQLLKVGGAGQKVLMVIEGKAHAYVFSSNGCKRWDTCAPGALLESVGGQLSDVFGNPIEYNHRPDGDYQNYLGVIATISPQLHSKVISSIPSEVKSRLSASQNQNLKSKF